MRISRSAEQLRVREGEVFDVLNEVMADIIREETILAHNQRNRPIDELDSTIARDVHDVFFQRLAIGLRPQVKISDVYFDDNGPGGWVVTSRPSVIHISPPVELTLRFDFNEKVFHATPLQALKGIGRRFSRNNVWKPQVK